MNAIHADTTPAATDAPVYAGFWIRFSASFIDSVIFFVVFLALGLLMTSTVSPNLLTEDTELGIRLIFNLLYMAIVTCFWVSTRATPGKTLFGLEVVDARTMGTMTLSQSVLRMLGYIVSSLVLGLGFLWVIWDPKRQGWHDKLAGSYVIVKPEAMSARFRCPQCGAVTHAHLSKT